jgi:hypothetical protein
MIIIAGCELVDAKERDAHVAAHRQLVRDTFGAQATG